MASVVHPASLDEARRIGQRDALVADVEDRVESEVAREAAPPVPGEARRVREIGRDIRARAVDDLDTSDREARRARGAARVAQIVDYVFGVAYALLAMRFALALLAARSSAGLVRFIVAITDPLYAPFRGIVASHRIEGGHMVLVPIIVAIVCYALLHLAIRGLLRLMAERRTSV